MPAHGQLPGDLARKSKDDGESQTAYICAEQAKSLADKVLQFDGDNAEARSLLELLSDEFNVM